jgi:hypothetical protein
MPTTGALWSDGLYVEIDAPNGETLRPTVLESSTLRASLNDVPRVEVHVPQDDRWFAEELRRADMRVWKDGERQPIERFERPVQQPDKTVLHGRGGIELDQDVAFDVGEFTEVHTRAEQLIQNKTPYVANVDTPEGTTREDNPLNTADSIASFQDTFQEVDSVSSNDVPVQLLINPSRLATSKIAWLQSSDEAVEATDLRRIQSPDTNWRGRAHQIREFGDAIEWEFEPAHVIPVEDFQFQVRKEQPVADLNPEIEFSLDGEVFETIPADLSSQADSETTWTDIFIGSPLSIDSLGGGTTHTFRMEVTGTSSSSDGEWIVDGIGHYDERYSSQLDFSLGDGTAGIVDGVLQGPGEYPSDVPVTTVDFSRIQQIVGGRFTVDANNTSGDFTLRISNDGGSNWKEASNATTVDGSFASGSTRIRGQIRLSRFTEDTTTSPAVGDGRQEVTLAELFADVDDTPFLQGTAHDGTVLEVLQQLADNYNFIFELSLDETEGTISVEWTQPGQRSATSSAPVLDYESETDSETLVESTLVYGRSRRLRDVEVELFTDGVFTDIGDDYLQRSSVSVEATDGTEYQIGEDFLVLHNEGVLRATASGAIEDGETVVVNADTRITGEFELEGADGSRDRIRRTVESASSARLATQAARQITKELSEPQRGATVTLSREDGLGLVGALDLEDAPIDAQVVREITTTDDEVQVRLGDRRSAGEVVDDVRRRVESVASQL